MAKRKGIRQELSQLTSSGQALEKQLQSLIAEKKYSQAIRKLQQALKRDPNQVLKITEADIWLQQGKHKFEQAQYSQAETALSKAISLGLFGDTHYFLAKSLLAQQKWDAALDAFQTAFDDKTLPKDLGGCYLKVLFLNDKADVVENLIKTQTKRFYAPHLHWARGVLALKAGDPAAALPHFQKMGRPASPGDHMIAWQAYAHQQAGDGLQAEKALGMLQPALGSMNLRTMGRKHPVVQRLILYQVAHTDTSLQQLLPVTKLPKHLGSLDTWVDLADSELPQRNAAVVLEVMHLVQTEDFYTAAHFALRFTKGILAEYPDLQLLYRPLMLLGGNQALQQQEFGCSVEFWGKVVDQPEFDPHLAMHLYKALDVTGARREGLKLAEQLLNWVQRDAKRNPQAWPEARLTPTLAKLHCWLADKQMFLKRYREAESSLRKAEQLAPEHPDVIGRKGLTAFSNNQIETAIPLLTQALETGCRFSEVYELLLDCLEDDAEAYKAIRRKFGKHFGDAGVDTEVDIPAWVEVLTFQNYGVMEEFVDDRQKLSAPLKALKIFLQSADDEPSSSQKITLNQEKAVPQWDELLQSHSPTEQVEILQAIYLVIQQHAKRNKKGIAALQSRYSQAIFALILEVPEAALAHLTLLPLKNLSPDRLAIAVTAALDRSAQPGNLLAKAQLQLCRFSPNRAFAPFIETQLSQDPQNPLLLLAKATLHARNSDDYRTFYDQGFEIARRLQDAEALQAFREEDWFITQEATRRALGSQMNVLGDPSQLDMTDFLKRMAREIFGMDVPPEIIAQMLPELEAQMANGFADLEEDEEFEDDDDFEAFFFPPGPGKGKKSSKKRKKPWFQL